MIKIFVPVLALLASGCSTMNSTPVLTADHPASLGAPASSIPAASTALDDPGLVLAAPTGVPDGGSHQHRSQGVNAPTTAPKDPPATTQADAATAAYVCPMHPEVTSDKPAKCPICGMKLVKKDEANKGGAGHADH